MITAEYSIQGGGDALRASVIVDNFGKEERFSRRGVHLFGVDDIGCMELFLQGGGKVSIVGVDVVCGGIPGGVCFWCCTSGWEKDMACVSQEVSVLDVVDCGCSVIPFELWDLE